MIKQKITRVLLSCLVAYLFPKLRNLYLQDENEEEEDLLDKAGGVLTSVLKEYKDQAMPLIDKLMPQIGQMLDQSRSAGERRVAICILDDLLEHSSAGIQALSVQQSTLLSYSFFL